MRNEHISAEVLRIANAIQKKIEEIKKMPALASAPSFKFSAEKVIEKKVFEEKKEKCDCKFC